MVVELVQFGVYRREVHGAVPVVLQHALPRHRQCQADRDLEHVHILGIIVYQRGSPIGKIRLARRAGEQGRRHEVTRREPRVRLVPFLIGGRG